MEHHKLSFYNYLKLKPLDQDLLVVLTDLQTPVPVPQRDHSLVPRPFLVIRRTAGEGKKEGVLPSSLWLLISCANIPAQIQMSSSPSLSSVQAHLLIKGLGTRLCLPYFQQLEKLSKVRLNQCYQRTDNNDLWRFLCRTYIIHFVLLGLHLIVIIINMFLCMMNV